MSRGVGPRGSSSILVFVGIALTSVSCAAPTSSGSTAAGEPQPEKESCVCTLSTDELAEREKWIATL